MEIFKSSNGELYRILEKGKCERHGEYVKTFDWWAGTTPEGINAFSAPMVKGCPCCAEEARSLAKFGQLCIPPRFRGKQIETYEATTDAQIRKKKFFEDYAKNLAEYIRQGRSIIMTGRPGTGKTHLACALLEVAQKQGFTGLFTSVAKIVRKVRETWRDRSQSEDETIQAFIGVDLLVIDEVGVQSGSDNEQQILFAVINGRYEEMRPTIVISNLDLDGVGAYLGERVFDRLRENGGRALKFDWDSKRKVVTPPEIVSKAPQNAPIESEVVGDTEVHPFRQNYQYGANGAVFDSFHYE